MAEFVFPRALKTSEVVAQALADHIFRSGFEDGERLPAEREMLESFGVGRASLREALRLLETRGLISIRMGPGGGPVVRRPRAEDLTEALTLILQFQGGVLQDVIEAREILECLNVRHAATSISAATLDELEDSVVKTRTFIEDDEAFLREAQRFHRTLNASAINIVLRVFNESLYALTHEIISDVPYTLEHRKAVARSHDAVLQALRRRDADAAVDAMRRHVRSSGRYWNAMRGSSGNKPIRWMPLDSRTPGRSRASTRR